MKLQELPCMCHCLRSDYFYFDRQMIKVVEGYAPFCNMNIVSICRTLSNIKHLLKKA